VTDFLTTLNDHLSDCYSVERELGGGGMSRVFVAMEKKLERRVVIKVLPPEIAAGISADRFRREIQLAAKLQHPHIVPVLSAGEVDGKPYFTMPFIAGESLRQRIARDGELPLEDAVHILRDLASALAYAHRNGIVHRDIKPDNVMLEDEYALVTDFGVAKALSASTVADIAGTITVAGTTMGTPAYMSPEQALADPSVDHRTDIYAFGVVAYEVLTGSPPFVGRNPQALMAAHAVEPPEPIAKRRPALPSWLANLVMSCLEKRPADRPQNASELLRTLQSAENVSTGGSLRAAVRPRLLEKRIAAGTVIIAGVITAIFLVQRFGAEPPAMEASGAIKSVAVLPLVNVGGSQQDEYFSDGMSDELANVLSRIPGLRVASRTSAYSFKGRKDVNVGEIGRALNVQAVLEGTVRRAGGKLRVTGQLTSVHDGLALWSDSYERDASDVFAVQDDIARSIAKALEIRLSAEAAASPSSASGTANLEAYDNYLRGRYFWNARGADNIRRAISYFDKAVAADPDFARAYAARAIAYALLPEYTDASPVDALVKTRADVMKALSLDSTLAEAHTGIALASVHNRDWDAAEASYKRAIMLDPRYPTAHQWYGELLYNTSRLDSSVAETRRATELDPLAPILATAHAYALHLAGHYDEALAEVKRGLELAPNLGVLHSVAAQVYIGLGDHANAHREMDLAVKTDPELTLRRGQLAYIYATTGDMAGAAAVLERMKRDRASETTHPVAFAIADLALGDTGKALDLLEQAESKHDIGLLTAASPLDDPMYAPIRRNPRFIRLMERMGLSRFMQPAR
jgi:TolB-like protein/Tfp pilus assembly protein PilF/tRNA A-37 threonylcarbamoyl transferase component Bud32